MSGNIDETMISVFVILTPKEDRPITETVLATLRRMFDDRLVSEIAAMTVRTLANEITARGDECDLPSEADAVDVAEQLLQFMERIGCIAKPAAAPTSSTIKVEFDKTPEQMNLRELLTALATDPTLYDEFLPYIEADRQVRQALKEATNWAIPTLADKKKLDAEATLAYVVHLGQPHRKAQRQLEDGRKPMSLAKLFGRTIRPLSHPLTGEPIIGPDEDGNDFGNLSPDLLEALKWARQQTATKPRHRYWPPQIDLFAHTRELFQEPLSDRWQTILNEYVEAKADEDDTSTDGINRYYDEPKPRQSGYPDITGGVHLGGAPEPVRDEAWYERQLRNAPAQAGKRSASGGITVEAQAIQFVQTASGHVHLNGSLVLGQVRVASGDIYLNNAVVLGPINTMSGDIRGRAFVSQGVRAFTASGDDQSEIYPRTFQQLYEQAIANGIQL